MQLWSDEDFYLQLDSHHRFVQDWDVKLRDQADRTGSSKPVISTYCQDYATDTGQPLSHAATSMAASHFTSDGIPMFRAINLAEGGRPRRDPLRARFVSAHFLFAPGSFATEIEYDPQLYFHGEEISLAMRAYTWGYDLFHPSEAIVFHRYSREGRPKHWDDHNDQLIDTPWHERDHASRSRVSGLLTKPWTGRFGCGPYRTAAQYQAYAGIDFQSRMINIHALTGDEPPNPSTSAWRKARLYEVVIDISRPEIPAEWQTASSCLLIIEDIRGNELHNIELQEEVVRAIYDDGNPEVIITLNVESWLLSPVRWTIWSFQFSSLTSEISGACRASAGTN